jgi:hypothetical protein
MMHNVKCEAADTHPENEAGLFTLASTRLLEAPWFYAIFSVLFEETTRDKRQQSIQENKQQTERKRSFS